MDPSKLQSDSANDVHSLEDADTVVESNNPDGAAAAKATSDATSSASSPAGGPSGVAPAPGGNNNNEPRPKKSGLLKRLWRKFNIYLLLFVLIILIAIGVTAGLFLKDQQAQKQAQSVVGSQSLSGDALKQLANSDVTVGNSKQVLKVESNAVFSGSVLVRSDLEVAGTIKVGGSLQLPGITVTGDSRFNQLQADNLTIGSSATVQGPFIAKKGIAVTGNSTFDGSLSAASISTNIFLLNGELKLTNHVVAGGPNPGINKGGALGIGGTASVSGSDTTGSIVINTGGGPGAGCFAQSV